MLHFRDLLNIGPILDINLEEELGKFRGKLIDAGWGSVEIHTIEVEACSHTRYEADLPRMPLERGDRFEYLRNKSHFNEKLNIKTY
jgi:hypothetical protein